MSEINQQETEERFEQFLGNLLRAGALLAATIVLVGGLMFLARHGGEHSDHKVFEGEPADLRHPLAIAQSALQRNDRGIIQLGLLVLIATPVARVAFSVIGFLRARDFLYVGLTLFVLAVLVYSLFFGQAL